MKGLLIKDFSYLKQNKILYIFLIVFGIAYALFFENPYFVFGYYSIFAGVLTLSTCNYDDYNHSLSFIFTLPITRNMYIKGKYYLSYLLSFILATAAFILGTISQFYTMHNLSFFNTTWFGAYISVFFISVLFTTLLLPLQIKLGGEKGQYAMFVVFGGLAMIAIIIYFLAELLGFDIVYFIDQIFETNGYILLGLFIIIVGIINAISMKISFHILEKKEF